MIKIVVYVIKDWESFRESVKWAKYILFKIEDKGEKAEIKIKAGCLGFHAIVSKTDNLYEEIINWLKYHDAIEVKETVKDEFFMS